MGLQWVVDALRGAGLTVIEYPGWAGNATSGAFNPRAVMWHHDASAFGPSPGVPAMIADQGNTSTPPPLAHAWVDTAGAWTMTAGGRANHAGKGSGWGRVRPDRGNEDALGVETDHTTGEAWPAAQLDGLRRGTAAILKAGGWSPKDALCGHKEYAPGRKPDPDGLDMAYERSVVAQYMEGGFLMALSDQEQRTMRDQLAHLVTGKAGGWNAGEQGLATANQLAAHTQQLAELQAQVADLQDKVGMSAQDVQSAAKTGTAEALAEGTVEVEITIAGNPSVASPG